MTTPFGSRGPKGALWRTKGRTDSPPTKRKAPPWAGPSTSVGRVVLAGNARHSLYRSRSRRCPGRGGRRRSRWSRSGRRRNCLRRRRTIRRRTIRRRTVRRRRRVRELHGVVADLLTRRVRDRRLGHAGVQVGELGTVALFNTPRLDADLHDHFAFGRGDGDRGLVAGGEVAGVEVRAHLLLGTDVPAAPKVASAATTPTVRTKSTYLANDRGGRCVNGRMGPPSRSATRNANCFQKRNCERHHEDRLAVGA